MGKEALAQNEAGEGGFAYRCLKDIATLATKIKQVQKDTYSSHCIFALAGGSKKTAEMRRDPPFLLHPKSMSCSLALIGVKTVN